MPSLNFKGKALVQNFHLLVPFHELKPVKAKSETAKASLHDNLATFSAGPANESAQSLVGYTVTVDNASLFGAAPAVNNAGVLAFTPAANSNGFAMVTVVAQDSAGTDFGGVDKATNTFTITVTALNDAPTFTLLLGTDGSVVTNHSVTAWGYNALDQATVPDGLTNVAAVAGGFLHSLALKADGTVVAWGYNANGQTNVPDGLTNVTAIAGGGHHSLALKSDGTVVAWGRNNFGQTNVPDGLSNVTAIAAGAFHSFALKSDGTVVAWGDNSEGQATVPEGLTNVIAIADGVYHSIALRSNGMVVAWGQNAYGQVTVPAGLTNVTAIAAGDYHSLALKSDRTVVAWGDNSEGQTTVPAEPTNLAAIAGGGYHNLALYRTGTTTNGYGGVIVLEDSGSFTRANVVENLLAGPPDESGQNVTFTVTNNNNALFLVQPSISASGTLTFTPATNANGIATVTVIAVDDGPDTVGSSSNSVPQIFNLFVTSLNDAPTVALSTNNVVTAEDSGANVVSGFATVTSFGPGNEAAQTLLGHGLTNNNPGLFSVQPAINIAGTLTFTPATNSNGVAIATVISQDSGGMANGGVDRTTNAFTITVTAVNDAPRLTVATNNVVVLEDSGPITRAGFATVGPGAPNESAQSVSLSVMNDNNGLFSAQPAISASGTLSFTPAANSNGVAIVTVIAQDSGSPANGGVDRTTNTFSITVTPVNDAPSFMLLVGTDGSVVTNHSVSAWGYNANGQATVPNGLSNVTAIAGGGFLHGLALKSDGKVVAWGDNARGQTTVPAGLTNVTAIATGARHSFALKSDKTVVAWGDSSGGQTSVPAGLTDVTAIAGGESHSLALKGDATVVAWGRNNFGQLSVPVGLTNVTAIACGDAHCLALRSDGTVIAWGDNSDGQATVPAGLTNVTAIAGGAFHSLALKSDGTVVAWGDNGFGQTSVPFGMTNLMAIAAGGFHNLALTSNGTVVAWGYNGAGQTIVPAGLTNVTAIGGGGFHSLALFTTYITNGLRGISVLENSGPFTQSAVAANISAGPPNESSQTVSFTVTNNNNALFLVQPAINSAGELTFTPAANSTGIALVTVIAVDDGGAPGVNNSAPQTFGIKVGTPAIAPPPAITGSAGYTPDGQFKFFIEFATTAGQLYFVQYKDAIGAPWRTSPIPVNGTGSPVSWMDDGAPNTDSPPSSARFYRVVFGP